MNVDRTTVLMSVRPQYADPLIAGVKRFEFRKQALPGSVTTLLVYRSGKADQRGVLGTLRVIGQEKASCWSWGTGPCARGYGHTRPDPRFGISINDLADYADPEHAPGILRAEVVGISVKVEDVFPEPVPLALYGVTTAPQSWRYAPAGWRSVAGTWSRA